MTTNNFSKSSLYNYYHEIQAKFGLIHHIVYVHMYMHYCIFAVEGEVGGGGGGGFFCVCMGGGG